MNTESEAIPVEYPRRTDEQIHALARDLIQGTVFIGDRVPPDLVSVVFTPLAFADQDYIDQLKRHGADLLYAYYRDGTLGRSVNGFPMFTSVEYLDSEDRKRLAECYERMQKALETA